MLILKTIHNVLLLAYCLIVLGVCGIFVVTAAEEGLISSIYFMKNIGYFLLWVIGVAFIHWFIIFYNEVRKDAEQN